MKNIFRRKSAFQVNIPKITEEQSTSSSSLLSEGKKISGIELAHLLSQIMYQKLKLIFQKTPQLQKYITLYNFSKSLPPNYQEFRQQMLKEQITKGLDLVLKLEEFIFKSYDKNKNLVIESPCPDLMHLGQPRQDWNRARQINYTIRQAFSSVNKIASLKINQNKNHAIYLLSLLTSLDAIPLDSIPIIDFDSLMINKEQVAKNNTQCISLLSTISKLEAENRRCIEKITMFKQKYDDTTPDDQTAQFHAIIRSFYDIYNKETHLFNEIPQTRIFHDFVAHPKIISSPIYQEFTSNISTDSFKKFVNDIIELYNVTDEGDKIISYLLCSFSYLPAIVDKITIGQNEKALDNQAIEANENEISKYFDLAFEVFITIDPVAALSVISNFIDSNESESIEDVIRNLIVQLEQFSPHWKEILTFIINYSIPKYLPTKLQSIRQAISVNI